MEEIIGLKQIQNKIINIRNKEVILDFNVAEIYGVDTKHINQAVKNNPDKFPRDYVFTLNKTEFGNIQRSKISTFEVSKNNQRSKKLTFKLSNTKYLPKAFTEKGLYMLATILKSKRATLATFHIIETFAKMRNMTKSIDKLSTIKNGNEKNEILQNVSKNFVELFNNLETSNSETSIEVNLVLLKLKHTIKNKN